MRIVLIILTACFCADAATIGKGTLGNGRWGDNAIYVGPNGSDASAGTITAPLATLEAAQTAARAKAGRRTVFIRGGTYYRTNALVLGAEDNNTTYQGYPGESVVLSGALSVTNFLPITGAVTNRLAASAKTNVLVADISTLSISDYGSLTNRSMSATASGAVQGNLPRPWMVELFFDNVRQQLARWPNQDQSGEVWAWTTTPSPASYDVGPTANWFTYREGNPTNWALTETVWVHGGWRYMWDDSYQQISSVQAATNAIITDHAGTSGFYPDGNYEALNALEELDQPGEWVINRASSLIYFWPPSTNASQRTMISVLTNAFMMISNASDVNIRGIVFDGARGNGISSRNSTNILIAGCTFRNLGNNGIVVGNSIYTNSMASVNINHDYEGGLNNQIVGCLFHDLSESGVVLSGGWRSTLTPCGHSVINCYFHDYSKNMRAARPAIRMEAVGATVSHCTIHDAPHNAIRFCGNDNVIEYCNIYRVCTFTADAGAIYDVAADWRQQGNVIRYNLLQPCGQYPLYMDDFTSGATIYGNVVMESPTALLIGGGRGNVFSNNLVIGYSSTAWDINNRGTTWATSSIPGLVTSLQTVNYTNGVYAKYPAMANLTMDVNTWIDTPSSNAFYELGFAEDNVITSNCFIKAIPHVSDMDTNRVVQTSNIYYYAFTIFTNFAAGTVVDALKARNFTLTTESGPIPIIGFNQLPQNAGVTNDSYGVVTTAMVPMYPPQGSESNFIALSIPGTIQAEDFNAGTNGSYNGYNNDYGNNAFAYRLEAPFYIRNVLVDGAIDRNMDMTYSPCYADYTATIAATTNYTMTVAWNSYSNGVFNLLCDGSVVATNITATNSVLTVPLPSGTHTLQLTNILTGNARLDYMTFTAP